MKISYFFKASFLKFISRKKSRSINLDKSQKILILMNQKIGDMVVCSPIIREIRKSYPKSKIHVLASEVNKEIAICNPYIDEVHIYKNQWQKLMPLLLQLRKINFDLAIELEYQVVSKIIILLKIVKPNCIIAVSKCVGRYGMGPQDIEPYDHYTNSKLTHQRDTCLDVLRLMNIKARDKSYDVFYPEINKSKALSFLSSFERENFFIGFNIEGSSAEKRITDEDVKSIIMNLHSRFNNLIIILIHKPDELDSIKKLIPKESSSNTFPSYPTKSIHDLAAIIDTLDLIISPDTSVVHIACAFNKPLVSIYRNNMPLFNIWHPISECNKVVFSKYPDSLKGIDIQIIGNYASELIKDLA